MNRTIPADINVWSIDFDPYGYARDESWAAGVAPVEDVLQLSHDFLDLMIDVGWYAGIFVVLVIQGSDWEQPVERLEVANEAELNDRVNRLVVKYVHRGPVRTFSPPK